MKLRFRGNSLRLRVNQQEVSALAKGELLKEHVDFPGSTSLAYTLKAERVSHPEATFSQGRIQIAAPTSLVHAWADGDDVGLYFTLPTASQPLKISIEKDLECIDGPEEERDPNAFPRALSEKVC